MEKKNKEVPKQQAPDDKKRDKQSDQTAKSDQGSFDYVKEDKDGKKKVDQDL